MDPEIKKKVLRKIVYGVYVVGVKQEGAVNAFTGTWVTQISFKPPLIVLAVENQAHSFGMISASRVLTLNFLGSDQKGIAQHFLKPAPAGGSKLEGIRYRLGKVGAPILEEAAAYAECEVRQIHPAGDHALVVAEVVEAGIQREADPLTLRETGWTYGG
ncbi:MAG: flavin reductase [Candidatus Omnitrophica bacterium]|nr:flavin reductase [Candidatus Omnitrophota bacterium]